MISFTCLEVRLIKNLQITLFTIAEWQRARPNLRDPKMRRSVDGDSDSSGTGSNAGISMSQEASGWLSSVGLIRVKVLNEQLWLKVSVIFLC